jgi:tryptophan halogenase
VFAGLGMMPEHDPTPLDYRPESVKSAEAVFAQVQRRRDELLDTLPPMHTYLRRLHGK